jgi:TolA-binding protein
MLRGDRDLQTAPDHPAPRALRSLASHVPTTIPRPNPLARAGLLALALVPVCFTGCQSFVSPLARWSAAYDGGLVRGPTKDEMSDVSAPLDSDSLLDRWLTPRRDAASRTRDGSSTLVLGSDGWKPMTKAANDPAAEAEFNAAHTLFQQGKLAEAEKEFARIAKKRKGSPVGEDCQYYLGETQFQRQNYFRAHDSFEMLHKDYPASDHIEKAVAREYEIAQLWLGQDDPKVPKDKLLPWFGRFDGRLPIVDVQGSALKALEHVRQNNPSGPLAETASKEIADYYVKHHDYDSAAMYYEQFMQEYRKSPRLYDVQLAAIDARMKGYLGPDYDAAGLEKARTLIRKTMDDFREIQINEKLYHTLDVINEAEAEKTYKEGAYYKKIGKVASAEYYFGKIPRRWQNSPWAVKAKTELAELAKMPRKPSKPSRMLIPPGSTDPFGGGSGGGMGGGMGGMGGMGMGGMGMGMGGMGMGMPGMGMN